jgi:hypothetical protein
LSCTFRCNAIGGSKVYVKLINDDNPDRLAVLNHRIDALLGSGPVSIVTALATDRTVSAISYRAAPGRALDTELVRTGTVAPVLQTIDALRRFWRLDLTPPRYLSRDTLLLRARECADLVAVMAPECTPALDKLMARLEAGMPRLALRPIHGDIKLEHVFPDGGRTTLIDTESVSLGPPDYDLAQLYGRLRQAEFEEKLPADLAERASAECRRSAGPGFDWCLDVVALRLAKYYAQRPAADSASRIGAVLQRLR